MFGTYIATVESSMTLPRKVLFLALPVNQSLSIPFICSFERDIWRYLIPDHPRVKRMKKGDESSMAKNLWTFDICRTSVSVAMLFHRGQRRFVECIYLSSITFSRCLHEENLPTLSLCVPALNKLVCVLHNKFRSVLLWLDYLRQKRRYPWAAH